MNRWPLIFWKVISLSLGIICIISMDLSCVRKVLDWYLAFAMNRRNLLYCIVYYKYMFSCPLNVWLYVNQNKNLVDLAITLSKAICFDVWGRKRVIPSGLLIYLLYQEEDLDSGCVGQMKGDTSRIINIIISGGRPRLQVCWADGGWYLQDY